MSRQAEHAAAFRRLHVAGDPLILFNIWSAGSARTVAEAGAPAIATSSWAVAVANGETDGERLPLPVVLETVRSIRRSVDLPVSTDIEGGYADSADGVGATIAMLIEAGAVGCNLEDGVPGAGRMRAADDQAARVRAARKAAQDAGLELFLNARTDAFLLAPPARHAEHVAEALARAKIYADAGADGMFVPGLVDSKADRRACPGLAVAAQRHDRRRLSRPACARRRRRGPCEPRPNPLPARDERTRRGRKGGSRRADRSLTVMTLFVFGRPPRALSNGRTGIRGE